MIHVGDCIEVMATLPADSVDAVVTDPPYGLEFMGKEWDRFMARGGPASRPDNRRPTDANGSSTGLARWNTDRPQAYVAGHPFQAWCEQWGREALRVTKPGGYLLAFGGTRTHHRLVCGLEDAGWVIRDELDWIYASGFPKGKANLKPAHEPIVLARKPGPLRPLAIDECRISTEGESFSVPQSDPAKRAGTVGTDLGISRADVDDFQAAQRASIERTQTLGRWPSNVLLDNESTELFDQPNPYVVGSGATDAGGGFGVRGGGGSSDWNPTDRSTHKGQTIRGGGETVGYGDTGGYSRFFIIPKADRADREPVLRPEGHEAGKRFSTHPTMKPTDLMRHLIRLVTPVGGVVLDPFAGSGTTGKAAELEGFDYILIEREPEYVAQIEARLNGTQRGLGLDVPAPVDNRPKPWHRNDTNAMTRGDRPRYPSKSLFGQGGGTGLTDTSDEEPAA